MATVWKRIGLVWMVVALCVLAAVPALAQEDVIRIGASVSLTGATAREGQLTRDGYLFWVEKVNAAGGIRVGDKQYKVELIVYDDRSDAQTSVRLTTRLITEDNVRFIFGPYSSGITNATSAIGERYRVLTIATTANAPDLYERGYRYLFGTLPLATTYLHPVLEMAASLPNPPKKVAIITPENLFAIAAAEGARAYAEELGFEVVYFARYPADTADVSSLLAAVRDAGAEVLLSTGFLQDGMLIVRQAKDLRYNPAIMGFTVAAGIPDFRINLGRDAEGIMGGEWWAPSMAWEDPFFGSASQYAAEFEQRFGYVPTYHAASSSVAGYLLQLAIERAGTLDTEAVRQQLLAMDEMTMFGPVRFDERGVNVAGAAAGFQIQDGQIVVLWPQEISQGNIVYPKPAWQ